MGRGKERENGSKLWSKLKERNKRYATIVGTIQNGFLKTAEPQQNQQQQFLQLQDVQTGQLRDVFPPSAAGMACSHCLTDDLAI